MGRLTEMIYGLTCTPKELQKAKSSMLFTRLNSSELAEPRRAYRKSLKDD